MNKVEKVQKLIDMIAIADKLMQETLEDMEEMYDVHSLLSNASDILEGFLETQTV